MSNKYYSGQGSLYMAARDPATGRALGFQKIGNVPELTINIETTKFEHKESESGARLVDLTIIQEKKGTIEFVLENLSLDNLAVGLWGQKATVAGATVSGEVINIPQAVASGMRFSLAHPAVSAVTITGPGGTPAYTAGDDYVLDAKNGTITVLGDIVTAAAAAATTVEVGYTYAGYTKLDAFTQVVAPERWLRFEGLNTVDGKAVILDMFRAQFDPLTGYGLINEELAQVTMTANLLADTTQLTGSQFFKQVNVT